MDELKAALEELFANIKSCGKAGIDGARVQTLQELAKTAEEKLKAVETEE
jgi:hypothetical protein